jgi:hypothetical protein
MKMDANQYEQLKAAVLRLDRGFMLTDEQKVKILDARLDGLGRYCLGKPCRWAKIAARNLLPGGFSGGSHGSPMFPRET